jgi:hypothetical protein
MTDGPREPEDPLGFIQRCVVERRIYWSYHVNMRMDRRSIARELILGAVETYEIIEAYPRDKYMPSYLVYATAEPHVLHILFATDIDEDNVRVVTAYWPDPAEWSDDLKSRRNP